MLDVKNIKKVAMFLSLMDIYHKGRQIGNAESNRLLRLNYHAKPPERKKGVKHNMVENETPIIEKIIEYNRPHPAGFASPDELIWG